MKILLATFNKTSYEVGYSDSLLAQLPFSTDIIVPITSQVILSSTYVVSSFNVYFTGIQHEVKVRRSSGGGRGIYYLSSTIFLNPDNSLQTYFHKILFFSMCVRDFITNSLNTYDVIHSFGCEVGLLPMLLKEKLFNDCPALVFTFFNLFDELKIPSSLAQNVNVLPVDDELLTFDTSDNDINILLEGIGHSDFIITNNRQVLKNTANYKNISLDLLTIIQARLDRIVGVFPGAIFNETSAEVLFNNQRKTIVKKQLVKDYFDIQAHGDILQPFWLYQLTSLTSGLNSRSLIYKIISESKNIPGYHLFLVDKAFITRFGASLKSKNVSFIVQESLKDVEEIKRFFIAADFMIDPSPFSYKTDTLYLAIYGNTIPIISSLGIGSDYIKDSQNGFLIAKNDLKSYKIAVTRALNMYNSPDFSNMKPPILPNWSTAAEKHMELYEKAHQINQHTRDVFVNS